MPSLSESPRVLEVEKRTLLRTTLSDPLIPWPVMTRATLSAAAGMVACRRKVLSSRAEASSLSGTSGTLFGGFWAVSLAVSWFEGFRGRI